MLAAIERRRACTLLDLRVEFTQLAPSDIWRVIDSLSRRGLVNRAGEFDRAYVGGVVFSPARLHEGSYDIPV